MYQSKLKIIFLGTPAFALPSLEKLISIGLKPSIVITQPDKAAGRSRQMHSPPVKLLAQKNNLTVVQPPTLKDKKVAETLKKISPDLGIVAAYGKIIPPNLLAIPKHGFLNIHPSLLPKYRGPSPIQTAILRGDEESGVTVILLDKGMDTGPILNQIKINLEAEETSESLHDKLSRGGANLLIETIPLYLSGQLKPKPQGNKQAVITKIITKEDGRINWSRKAQELDRQIRAYYPWPGSWTIWQNKKLKIIKAIPVHCDKHSRPGLVSRQNKNILVSCGQNCLSIKRLQLEGKKDLSIDDFMQGHSNFINAKLK